MGHATALNSVPRFSGLCKINKRWGRFPVAWVCGQNADTDLSITFMKLALTCFFWCWLNSAMPWLIIHQLSFCFSFGEAHMLEMTLHICSNYIVSSILSSSPLLIVAQAWQYPRHCQIGHELEQQWEYKKNPKLFLGLMLHSRVQMSLRLQAAYSNFCHMFIIPFINYAVDVADLNAPISWLEMDQQP